MKSFLIRIGDGDMVIGYIGNEKPCRQEIRLELGQIMNREINEINFGYSGWRTYENIKKEIQTVRNEFEKSISSVNKNNYSVRFYKEV